MLRAAAVAAVCTSALLACGSSNGQNDSGTAGAADATQETTTTAGAQAAAGVRLQLVGRFDSPLYVTVAARRSAPRDGRRAGWSDPRRARRTPARRAVPGHPLEGRWPAASRACWGSRSRRTTRAAGASTSITRAATAASTSSSTARASADRADAGSARSVLVMDDPEANHNGGSMQFGPDGLLYIGTGDGGGGGRPARRQRQRPEPRLAARASCCASTRGRPAAAPTRSRLEPVRAAAPARAARSTPTGCATRGASRSTAQTGDLVIADVGQDAVEEVDFVRRGKARGANFGWRAWEGRSAALHGRRPGVVFPVIEKPTATAGARSPAATSFATRAARASRALRLRRLLPRPACAARGCRPAGPADDRAARAAARIEPLLVRRGRGRAGLRRSRSAGRSTGCRPANPSTAARPAHAGARSPRRGGGALRGSSARAAPGRDPRPAARRPAPPSRRRRRRR